MFVIRVESRDASHIKAFAAKKCSIEQNILKVESYRL